MNEVIGGVLQVVTIMIAFFQLKIDIDPNSDDSHKKISIIQKLSMAKKIFTPQKMSMADKISMFGLSAQMLYVIVNTVTKYFGIHLIFAILRFLHAYPFIVVIYIAIIALLSPISAKYEHEKRGFKSKDIYPIANGVLNFLGFLAASAMFLLVCDIIPNFNVLKRFQIEAFVSIFISLSATLVLLYQSTELAMAKNQEIEMDHDPSIQWLNQRINMLHLFNAYFFPLISVVYVIAYTIYCRIYQIQLVMDRKYIGFLILALLYFYILSLHPYEYLYKIFLIATPAILITSTYWMSWFVRDRRMIYIESGFIVINLIIFSLRVICKTEMPVELKDLAGPKGLFARCRYIYNENIINIFVLFIAIIAYFSVVLPPLMTERIRSGEAENYICAICRDTDYDWAQLVEKARNMATYDAESGSYDKMDYMEFINEELKTAITSKQIKEGNTPLEYDELEEWYKNIPITN